MKWLTMVLVLAGLVSSEHSVHAGRERGPSRTVEVVYGHDADVYNIRFRGGEFASIRLVGDGSTDLDVYVYDSCGRLVASSCGPCDSEIARWYVPCSDTYRIRVRNYGSCDNYYVLTTN